MEPSKVKNVGIRIAGTLLAYYRERKLHPQRVLADKIGASKDIVSKFERGNWSSDFIRTFLVHISDFLELTGPELMQLQSATDADDFLRDLRVKHPTEDEFQFRTRAFESLLVMPYSPKRHWLRIVFDTNKLGAEIQHPVTSATTEPARASPKLMNIIARDLVDQDVLKILRRIIQDAGRRALDSGLPLDQMSQILLYWARSVMTLDLSDPDHEEAFTAAVIGIESALARLSRIKTMPTRYVVERHLVHAMFELKHVDVMCSYLSRTHDDQEDAQQNLRFLVRRSADIGDGDQAMELLVRHLDFHSRRSSLAICTLDLRTISQLITANRPDGSLGSTAMENLRLTTRLAQLVTLFLGPAKPDSFSRHECAMKGSGETCQDATMRYARKIVGEIAAFSRELPTFGNQLDRILDIDASLTHPKSR